jgi:hypothetical protein
MAKIGSLCVYCGSSSRGPQSHKDAAVRLGGIMAARGIRLVYGGGRVGLMGILADAAIAGGGEVVGVIPRFLDQYEIGHTGIARLEITESMHERKQLMAELSDGFVVLPGGLGTLDETFEIVTWKQLNLHDKPIVIVNIDGYWQPLERLIGHAVSNGYARPENAEIATFVATVDDVLPKLEQLPTGRAKVDLKWL